MFDDIENARFEAASTDHVGKMAEANAWLNDTTFRAKSENGLVTVTVSVTGRLVGVEIDPRLFRPPVDSKGVSAAILQAADRAVEVAEERTQEALAGVLGESFDLEATKTVEGLGRQFTEMGRFLQGRMSSEVDGDG